MYTGVFFLIQAIFYMFLLVFVYFHKKRIRNTENSIYSLIVVIIIFELFLELILDIVGPRYVDMPSISYGLAKFYCVFIQLWITCLCIYIVNLSLKMKNCEQYSNLVKYIFTGIFVISSIAIFALPINFHYDGFVAYTYGPSVNIVYLVSFLFSFIGIGCLIWNINNIRDRRFFPMVCFLILGSIGSYIQYKNPGLLLAVPIHAFITFLMYFTIENPDMLIIEEMSDLKGMISKSNESKTLFIYNITQNLRFPIMNINKIISVSRDEKDNKILREYLSEITSETNKLDFLINDALNISSIHSEKIRIYNKEYDFKNIIKELELRYYDNVNNSVDFRINVLDDIPDSLYGDALRLKQVLFSLVNYSVKNTKEGYIELDFGYVLKQDVCRLFITLEDTSDKVEEKEEKDKQLDNEKMDLSLKSTEYIVNEIGGTMMIDRRNNGRKIMIILDQVLANKENNSIYRKMVDMRKRVVYIDNNYESIKRKYNKYFSLENIQVDYHEYGLHILDRIRKKETFDLIVINDNIKRLSAIEAVEKIIKKEKYQGKIIVIGPGQKRDIYQKLGIYKYIDDSSVEKDLIMDILKILR